MQKKEVVISVKNVRKNFYLPHEKNNSLKSAVVNVFRKKDKGTNTQRALRGVSFDIHKGEFFGIVGRNGSGKSTLLKILAQIYQPTNGRVETSGKLVPFIELGVGFNPELTGRENVYLNGALLGFSTKEVDAIYDEIVEFAELQEFMEQKLKNYSSGMQVRLAFSVATHAKADVLLIDEVLAVGDADFQRNCYEYFKSLKKSDTTIVFVTHDMSAVRYFCDQVVLIEEGVVAHAGSANDVADEYLKLFNKSSEGLKKLSNIPTKKMKRWGNGLLKIKTADVNLSGDDLQVEITLASGDEPVDEYVLGYKFVDAEGKSVAEGDTLNTTNGENIFLSIDANKKTKLVFTTPNILGNGKFTLSAGVRTGDGLTYYDMWDEILEFEQNRPRVHYPVVIPASLEQKKAK